MNDLVKNGPHLRWQRARLHWSLQKRKHLDPGRRSWNPEQSLILNGPRYLPLILNGPRSLPLLWVCPPRRRRPCRRRRGRFSRSSQFFAHLWLQRWSYATRWVEVRFASGHTSCYIDVWYIMICHYMSCQVLSFHDMICQDMSRYVIICNVMGGGQVEPSGGHLPCCGQLVVTTWPRDVVSECLWSCCSG